MNNSNLFPNNNSSFESSNEEPLFIQVWEEMQEELKAKEEVKTKVLKKK